MPIEMSFGGGEITGKLREGAEERIRASSLSGVEGKHIVIESVTINYRLENQLTHGEASDVQAARFDDWAV